MTTPVPECPACRVRMQDGVVFDAGDHNRLMRTYWTEGRPEKSLLQGYKAKGHRHLETVTFRCPSCGWLIWFAPESSEAES